MIPVRSHSDTLMSAFINVSATPYAITGRDGHYTIANLAPGSYTIAAVHESLAEQDMDISVLARPESAADLSFSTQ